MGIYNDYVKPTVTSGAGWASFSANAATAATAVAGGISNLAAGALGLFGFGATQVVNGYSNREARARIKKSDEAIKALRDELTRQEKSSQEIKAVEEPADLKALGTHSKVCPEAATSSTLVITNWLLMAAATGCTIAANVVKPDVNDMACPEQCEDIKSTATQDFCRTALCVSAYTLGALAVLLSTLEQHIKKINLADYEKAKQGEVERLWQHAEATNADLKLLRKAIRTIHLPQAAVVAPEGKAEDNKAAAPNNPASSQALPRPRS